MLPKSIKRFIMKGNTKPLILIVHGFEKCQLQWQNNVMTSFVVTYYNNLVCPYVPEFVQFPVQLYEGCIMI
jgi:hypothetical protein